MKFALVVAVLVIAACKKPEPAAQAPALAAPVAPAPAEKMDPDAAMKYVTGLQAEVKRASEAKAKADAANAKAKEAEKLP